MKDLELNKIAASILVAGLIAMITGKIADFLYHPTTESDKRGYTVEITNNESQEKDTNAKEEEQISLATLLAEASAENGQKIAKKCLACHSFDKGGPNKVGPALWGVVGAKIAHREDYNYSDALKNKTGTWNYEELYTFINSPKNYAPGTKMTFAGLKKQQDIADLLAYIREQSDNPLPLPQQ